MRPASATFRKAFATRHPAMKLRSAQWPSSILRRWGEPACAQTWVSDNMPREVILGVQKKHPQQALGTTRVRQSMCFVLGGKEVTRHNFCACSSAAATRSIAVRRPAVFKRSQKSTPSRRVWLEIVFRENPTFTNSVCWWRWRGTILNLTTMRSSGKHDVPELH